MTDSFVTQCPHCQTSFRVSREQLSAARGVVRCGACLQVFNAARQLLEERNRQAAQSEADRPAVEPPPTTPRFEPVATVPAPRIQPEQQSLPIVHEPPGKDASPTATVDDLHDMDLDIDLDEELARFEQRHARPRDDMRASGFSENAEANISARRDEPDDDDWHDGLQNDSLEPLVTDPEQPRATPLTEQALEDEAPGRTEPSLSLGAEPLDDNEPMAPHGGKEPATNRADALAALEEDEPGEHDDQPPLSGKRARPVHEGTLRDLDDDPLRLDWRKPKPRWGRRLLWALLVLLALAGLAGQYVWYHFEELARQDRYRPWFEQLCPQLGCKVPSKVEITLLKSSNLVVRSHPEFQGALVVDAIIYNRASFSQPFPLLELRFADSNGQLIASRRFKPGEYLSGELAGKEEMPPQTPIHISLDILDPGPKAVNYSLSFRSPE